MRVDTDSRSGLRTVRDPNIRPCHDSEVADGTGYGRTAFPKGAKFFDLASSVDQVPLSSTYVGGVAPAANPCGATCPSTTGG